MGKGKFLRIKCPRCNKHQTIFGKSATIIKCDKCNKRLINTTGGKTKVKAQILEIMDVKWN